MLRFFAHQSHRRLGLTRREVLRVGGVGALFSGGAGVFAEGSADLSAMTRSARAKSVVFVTLYGGPPQTETFDMKPEGPAEGRPFRPIPTVVPGIDICEHLPRLATVTHLSTIVRSFSHTDTAHAPGLYTFLTGWPHPLPNTNNPASPDDYPHYGSVIGLLAPPEKPVPPCMIVGGRILPQFQGIGQTGGFLGAAHEPMTFDRNLRDPRSFRELISLSDDVSPVRLDHRRRLCEQLESNMRHLEGLRVADSHAALQQRAYRMLTSSEFLAAFELERETVRVRDAYGHFPLGENLLLARRLLEAGVPTVQVSDIPRGGEHHWDLHYSNIFSRLKDSLLPWLDQAVSAFLVDLNERGLLDETLVIVGGEFGRTPWIAREPDQGGRQHWPNCYSMVLAGAGIRQGEVYGASDKAAAYPSSNPVAPWDLGATILQLAGIDPAAEIHDRLGRPRRLCLGNPITGLL